MSKKKTFTANIRMVAVADLIPYARNSRTHSEKQIQKLAKGIEEFGFLNPIVTNGENGILAGHGRIMAAELLGMEEVPVIEASHLNSNQRRAYVMFDNRVAEEAGWNEKALLREILDMQNDDYDLTMTGFDDNELAKILGDDIKEEVAGEIEFSEEVGEAHNYVVLYFDNEIDWLSAQTHFELKSVHSKRANGKPWSKGIGRVINGAEYLKGQKNNV